MKNRSIIKLLIVLIYVTINGCSKPVAEIYEYKPIDDVKLIIQTRGLYGYPDTGSVFLFIDLTVQNHSKNEVYLDIGRLKASVNGINSGETHYDSLASVIPEEENLALGESRYELYFVFPDKVGVGEGYEFKLINYGLNKR